MQADPAWRELYAAGQRLYTDGDIAPRLVVWLGAMATSFATVAAWSTPVSRLALVALGGRAVSIIGAAWLYQRGFALDGPAVGWAWLLVAAVVAEAVGWLLVLRGRGAGLAIATGAGSAAMVAAVVVREAPRLALLDPSPGAQGGIVFVLALAIGVGAVTWVVRIARASRP
jgi:hypothetical protein